MSGDTQGTESFDSMTLFISAASPTWLAPIARGEPSCESARRSQSTSLIRCASHSCVNTDEASSQSCNAFRIAAEALAGPDVSSGLPVQSSATSAATSAASSATSAASSVASSASSAVSSVASAVSSGANPSASASASGSAAPAQSSAPVSGATSQVKVASAVVGAMVAAVVGAVVVV